MSIRKLPLLTATAALLTATAWAATPVAVWDGDFTELTKGTYTLSENGNTKTDTYLQISGDNGIMITNTVAMNVYTVIMRCSGLNLSTNVAQVLFTSYSGSDSAAASNKTGVYLPANNAVCRGIWEGADWNNGATQGSVPSNYTTLVYNHQQTNGTYAYALGPTSDENQAVTRTTLYSVVGLRSSGFTYYGCNIGGLRGTTSTTLLPATGLKITAIAVFSGTLSEADMKSYVFPSEITEYTATETVSGAVNWADINFGSTWSSSSSAIANITLAGDATITLPDGFVADAINFTGAYTVTLKSTNGATIGTVTAEKDVAFADSGVAITTINVPVIYSYRYTSALVSSTAGITYAAGAGSETSRVTINPIGGLMTLTGTEKFWINGEGGFSGTQTSVLLDGVTADYGTSMLGVGQADYVIQGASTVTATRVILSQGYSGRTASLTLKDSSSLTISGTTSADENTSSVMFGHWNGPSTFTLADNATFSVPSADVLVGKTANKHTININGGVFTAQGIKLASQATGTNIMNLNGGKMVLGTTGITSYRTSEKMAVNVGGDTEIKASAATLPISQNITLMSGVLSLSAASADTAVNLTGAVTSNGGSLSVSSNVILDLGTSRPKISALEGSMKLTTTAEELVAGKIDMPVADGLTESITNKISVANSTGDAVAMTAAAVSSGTLEITLNVNAAITEGGDIGDLIPSGASGVIVIDGQDADNPITITFNGTIPTGVTEVQVIGAVILQGTIPNIVKPLSGATITINTATTIANTDATVSYIVADGGTLKISGTYPTQIRVDEGGVFDVNGVADKSYPVVLNGGTMTNTGDGKGTASMQNWTLSVMSDSYIDTAKEFGMIASWWGNINFSLAGNTLTKTGTGQFDMSTITFVGGGKLKADEGTIALSNGFTVPSGATLALEVGEDGKLSISGTITKNGTLNITNDGEVVVYSGTDLVRDSLTGSGTIVLAGGSADFSSNGSTLANRFEARSGTSTLKLACENGGSNTPIFSGDSKDDPFIKIDSGATLNLNYKNFSGWTGSVTDGWIVNAGTLNIGNLGGSGFFRNHLVVTDGATTMLTNYVSSVILYGGVATEETAQIQLASGSAEIAGSESAKGFNLDNDYNGGGYGNAGAGITVGEDATLTISARFQGSQTLAKYGAGTLVLSCATNNITGTVSMYGGTIKSATPLTVKKGSGAKGTIITSTEDDCTVYRLKDSFNIILR